MINRREFVKGLAAGATGLGLGKEAIGAAASQAKLCEPFLLSCNGCGRATAYHEANKIVTVGEKTHVAWLDSIPEGFRVCIRTLDRRTGAWSSTYTVGEAFDNHGGPALTVDGKGHLHVVYYPHGHPFRYRRSLRPNDASEWGPETQFGSRCTYPVVVCGTGDMLYLVCRQINKGNEPWTLDLYTKRTDGPWEGPRIILRSDAPGYSQFQQALAWGPDHHTLHLTTRIYSGGRGHTVGYLRSHDLTKTWERSDGTAVQLPASPKSIDIIDSEPAEGSRGFTCGSVIVDGSGRAHMLYSQASELPWQTWLATSDGRGHWTKRPLPLNLDGLLPGRCAILPGGMTLVPDGRVFITLTASPTPPPQGTTQRSEGMAMHEVVWAHAEAMGREFQVRSAPATKVNCARWLPNIERPTGHHRITAPGMIYTEGTRGKSNNDILSNRVYWVG